MTETKTTDMPTNRSVLIDLDEVIRRKFGANKLPRFAVSWLKKFIHQDYLNEYLRRGTVGIDFATGALEYFHATVTVEGLEDLPKDGRFTFAGNHPLGGIDALGVVSAIGSHFDGKIAFLANDFLMAFKQLDEYNIPVNKTGGQSSSLPKRLDEAFASDRQIIVFPAGLCSRRIDGIVQDLPWKKTFITKSRASQRDVVPMWFSGENSKRFYRLDRLCKMLKIKFNLAMLTLPDEMYKGRNKSYRLVFGKPIPWQTFTKQKKDAEWAAWVRDKVYELKK